MVTETASPGPTGRDAGRRQPDGTPQPAAGPSLLEGLPLLRQLPRRDGQGPALATAGALPGAAGLAFQVAHLLAAVGAAATVIRLLPNCSQFGPDKGRRRDDGYGEQDPCQVHLIPPDRCGAAMIPAVPRSLLVSRG